MKIRRSTLALAAATIALILALAACEFSIIIPDTNPTPQPEPELGLTFSLEWSDNGIGDPHLYLTYPAPAGGDTTSGGTPLFTEPYLLPDPLVGAYGFYPVDIAAGIPDEATDYRGAVYYGDLRSNLTIAGKPAVQMMEINDASEVTIVRGFPFASLSTVESTSGGGITGLHPGSYTWVGIMEVYAYATSGQLEYASGSGVNAVLNVFDDGELLAVYELPSHTDLKGATIVRINCFYDAAGYEVYQLVPDIRVIQSTTQIRSIAPSADVNDDGIVTIRRPAGS